MQLTKSQIKELQDIFKEEYNRELTWKEATDTAYRLVGYFELLNKIYSRQHQKNEESPKLSVSKLNFDSHFLFPGDKK